MSGDDLKEQKEEIVEETQENSQPGVVQKDLKKKRMKVLAILLGLFLLIPVIGSFVVAPIFSGTKEKVVREFDPEAIENEVMATGQEIRFDNGDFYKGEVNGDGKPHGMGHYAKVSDGSVYIGEFENGIRTGVGWITSADGEFRGVFKDDKPNGFGIIKFNDFTGYEGGFKDGTLHGEGQILFMDSPTEAGRWENGEKVEDLPIKERGNPGGFFASIVEALQMVGIWAGIALGIVIFVFINRNFNMWYFGIGGFLSFLGGCIFAGIYIVSSIFGF